jgi:hypothetical protein
MPQAKFAQTQASGYDFHHHNAERVPMLRQMTDCLSIEYDRLFDVLLIGLVNLYAPSHLAQVALATVLLKLSGYGDLDGITFIPNYSKTSQKSTYVQRERKSTCSTRGALTNLRRW